MNIFASLKVYAAKWTVKVTKDAEGNIVPNPRNFTKEEIDYILHAEVVPSQFGNSVELTPISGGKSYIPLDRDSTLGVGDIVDLTKAKLLTLEKQGEKDIIRIVF